MELPKVFLENVPLTTKSELSTIVQSHGGSVVENIDDASHVVEWNEEMDTTNEENNDRVEYARPVEIRSDALILLHFWQYPDHYDEWFSSDDIEGIDLLEIANSVNRTKWHVSAKFIKDCEIFNEWGNELDYEIENESTTDIDEENLIDQKPLSKKVRKAKGNRGYDFLSLKKDQMIEEAVTVTDKLLTDIPPASTTSKSHNVYDISVDPQSSFLTTVNGAEKRKSNEALDNIEEQSKRLKSSKNSSSSQLKSPLKYPDWFKSDVISSMECRYMPQLLQSSSKSNISEYIRIRQQIILIDSQNPNFYLSATESRQKIIGDVGMIIATHEFLDAFNIINQGVKPESRPTPSFSIFSSTHEQPIINKFDHDDIDLQLLIKVAEIGNDWSNVSSSLRSKNIDLSPHECLNRFLALANLNDLLDSAKIKSESTPGNTDKRADTSYMSSLLVRKIETEVAAKAMENEYLELRLSILEDKVSGFDSTTFLLGHLLSDMMVLQMKLVSNIHSILHEDRERLEIERRDLIIQKAQNAFNQRSKS